MRSQGLPQAELPPARCRCAGSKALALPSIDASIEGSGAALPASTVLQVMLTSVAKVR
jgi:hypothetical protein